MAKIMIVDDERIVALDMQMHLCGLGHTVATASSREEAVARAAEMTPDLVLMDIDLGRTDGIETAMEIRKTMRIPIIYVTAHADDRTLERARITEPYGYLVKPFDERELRAAIEMAMYRCETERRRDEREKWQLFMAEASNRLASSLDCQAVIKTASELIVPRYADWCFVCLEEEEDEAAPASFGRGRDESVESATRARRVVRAVLRSGLSELHPTICTPPWLADALGLEDAAARHALDGRSLLCVPLIGLGRTLGAMAWVSPSNRRYGASDLAFAENLAHRLGMAIDNGLLYREAQRATHLREEILAIVSHDLRSPLTTLLLGSDRLSTGRPLPDGGALAMSRAAKRMDRLIVDLLDVATIDASGLSIQRGVHSAAALVHEVIGAAELQAAAKSIGVVCELCIDDPYADCDRDRILQVLTNLLGNAIKFTPDGGSIVVRVTGPLGGEVRFAVADTGPGISPDDLDSVFECFWKAPRASREGAGLGLHIAKGIVEAHGGKIGVGSVLGGGTTFYFTLRSAVSDADSDGCPSEKRDDKVDRVN